MAQNDIANILGVTNAKGRTRAGSNADQNTPNVVDNAESIAKMRTRLTAQSATTYTETVLNNMTRNDMLYALRVTNDASNVK